RRKKRRSGSAIQITTGEDWLRARIRRLQGRSSRGLLQDAQGLISDYQLGIVTRMEDVPYPDEASEEVKASTLATNKKTSDWTHISLLCHRRRPLSSGLPSSLLYVGE
ncbi:hypothetical protein CLAIMM_14790, partial [Cladophialophora immunda]